MFGPGHTQKTITKAAEIKYSHIPDRLYKYRSFSENHIKALKEGVLYFTSTDLLNDIKEANLVITAQAEKAMLQVVYNDLQKQYGLPIASINSPASIIENINIHFKQKDGNPNNTDYQNTAEYQIFKTYLEMYFKTQVSGIQKKIRSMYSVCCFSATNIDNQMWALYSDSHNGFCIEYDFKSLGIDNLYTAYLFPVIYQDDNRIYIDDMNHIDGNIGMYAATQKEKCWEYEQEWRLMYSAKDNGKPQPMPKPTAIYAGQNAQSDNLFILKEYCCQNSIPLYRMQYNQRTNQIERIIS